MNVIAPPVRWQPDRAPKPTAWPMPDVPTAMLRGARGLCPACGQTRLFAGYLRVAERCAACEAPLGEIRADDAPPYFTILIVGHIVVPVMYFLERAYAPSLLLQTAIWVPVTTVLTLALLRPIKGATLGLMLRLGLARSGQDG